MDGSEPVYRIGNVYSVTLPRQRVPAFPNRCVVCGTAEPGTKTLLLARDGLKGAAIWTGWFALRVPACAGCGQRLRVRRFLSVAGTLLIAGAAFAFGMVYLLPRLPGFATGLIVLGLIILGFGVSFVINRFYPPPFDVDPHDVYVEYEFRNPELAKEFVELNTPGGWEPLG